MIRLLTNVANIYSVQRCSQPAFWVADPLQAVALGVGVGGCLALFGASLQSGLRDYVE